MPTVRLTKVTINRNDAKVSFEFVTDTPGIPATTIEQEVWGLPVERTLSEHITGYAWGLLTQQLEHWLQITRTVMGDSQRFINYREWHGGNSINLKQIEVVGALTNVQFVCEPGEVVFTVGFDAGAESVNYTGWRIAGTGWGLLAELLRSWHETALRQSGRSESHFG